MINSGIVIVFICVGLPIICGTIISLNKQDSKKARMGSQDAINEMYNAIKDMKKRISNLETILYERENRR